MTNEEEENFKADIPDCTVALNISAFQSLMQMMMDVENCTLELCTGYAIMGRISCNMLSCTLW